MQWLRAIPIRVVVMVVETIHGVLRGTYLERVVGDFRIRQIGVLTDSLLILLIAYLFSS